MKPQKRKDDYYKIQLFNEGKRKYYNIHRLVAEAFIPNPNNYPIVNHIDEKPSNNCVDNLEWCTAKHNCNYGKRNEKISKAHKGIKHTQETKEKLSKINSIPILQFSKEGEFIKQWESARQASKELNINQSDITQCCKGKHKYIGGFKWTYLNENKNKINILM